MVVTPLTQTFFNTIREIEEDITRNCSRGEADLTLESNVFGNRVLTSRIVYHNAA